MAPQSAFTLAETQISCQIEFVKLASAQGCPITRMNGRATMPGPGREFEDLNHIALR